MNLRLAALLGFLMLTVALIYPLGIAAEPLAQPKIPHTLDGRDNCLACHGPGGLKPVRASHAGRNVATCRGCHQVAAAGQTAETTAAPSPASAPTQTFTTEATPTAQTLQSVNQTPPSTPQQPAAAAQPAQTATAPLPKSGDGDFIIVAVAALALIGLGIGLRKLSTTN